MQLGTHAIKVATEADLPGLLALGDAVGLDRENSVAQFGRDLTERGRQLYVAVDGEKTVGYGRVAYFEQPDMAPANTSPRGYYLGGLHVLSAYRRRGIGQALTVRRLRWIFQRSAEAWFFTNVNNHASRALHEQLGFQLVTSDFWFPRVTFEGGVGVLYRVEQDSERTDSDTRPDAA